MCVFFREIVLFSDCRTCEKAVCKEVGEEGNVCYWILRAKRTTVYSFPARNASTEPRQEYGDSLGRVCIVYWVSCSNDSRCAEVCVISKETLTWRNYHM